VDLKAAYLIRERQDYNSSSININLFTSDYGNFSWIFNEWSHVVHTNSFVKSSGFIYSRGLRLYCTYFNEHYRLGDSGFVDGRLKKKRRFLKNIESWL